MEHLIEIEGDVLWYVSIRRDREVDRPLSSPLLMTLGPAPSLSQHPSPGELCTSNNSKSQATH